MEKLIVRCECLTEEEEKIICEFCFGTGEVDTYMQDNSTGYNLVVDGTKPCICQLPDEDDNQD